MSLLKQLDGCCRYIDYILIRNYGYFEYLLRKISSSELIANRNGNNIRNIHYLYVNLIIKDI